ncbi:MAG TPA: GNAT family N-acetyltransferase [Gemmatimonadales bacterium]|nr:GNAT family N-acetyltransferase [Gemmatimonadales bacterium]
MKTSHDVAVSRVSRADTAARADEAFVTHVSWALERTAGMVTQVRPDLVLADSGLPCDTFNFVCRARLDRTVVRQAALEAASYFARVQRPFSWWVGPADQPRDLAAVLEDLGLQPEETELAMSMLLDALPAAVRDVPGLEVRRVRTEAELDAFAQIAAANWSPPDPHVLTFYRRTSAALLSAEAPQWLYLGYLGGEPVATAEATLNAGTVALFNIATREPFRGRGIGSRITWRPLRDAYTAGCDLAVLQAAEAGVGLYRRLGFTDFGRITEYKPGSSADSA